MFSKNEAVVYFRSGGPPPGHYGRGGVEGRGSGTGSSGPGGAPPTSGSWNNYERFPPAPPTPIHGVPSDALLEPGGPEKKTGVSRRGPSPAVVQARPGTQPPTRGRRVRRRVREK